jgi:diaminopimelate epimerase
VRHRRVRRGRGRERSARFPGGVLQIERLDGDEVLLTGPAVRVAEGVVDPSWLGAVTG